jgi:hypothetical protein
MSFNTSIMTDLSFCLSNTVAHAPVVGDSFTAIDYLCAPIVETHGLAEGSQMGIFLHMLDGDITVVDILYRPAANDIQPSKLRLIANIATILKSVSDYKQTVTYLLRHRGHFHISESGQLVDAACRLAGILNLTDSTLQRLCDYLRCDIIALLRSLAGYSTGIAAVMNACFVAEESCKMNVHCMEFIKSVNSLDDQFSDTPSSLTTEEETVDEVVVIDADECDPSIVEELADVKPYITESSTATAPPQLYHAMAD